MAFVPCDVPTLMGKAPTKARRPLLTDLTNQCPIFQSQPLSECGMHRYRLSLWFALTSLFVIGGTAIVVNLVIGNLTERNLVRTAEESTTRDAIHLQAMMGRHLKSTLRAAGVSNAEQETLSLKFLASPSGLGVILPSLVEGLNVVKLSLFDLKGEVVWSTDSNTKGLTTGESSIYETARHGGTASMLVNKLELPHLDGVVRTTDVVETFVPLRESAEGHQIGILEIYRDVSSDIAVQVSAARTTVLWTTVASMGVLFAILAGFVVFAETNLIRSRRRELEAADNRLIEREKADEVLLMLQRRLLVAQESERNRVARELHDEIGQDLTEIKLLLERTPKLSKEQLDSASGQGQELVAKLIDKVRDISTNLIPSILVDFGLNAALEELIERQREQGGLRIRFESSMSQERLGSEIETAAYRIVQEGLTNVIRHSSAEEVAVLVWMMDGSLKLLIEDNGVGLESAAALDSGTSVGLPGMRQRVQSLGGELTVESAHGRGTRLDVTLPLGQKGTS